MVAELAGLCLINPAPLTEGLGELVKLPPPVAVRVAEAENWTIQSLPNPKSVEEEKGDSLRIRVDGKWVTIGPNPENEHVNGLVRGSDGSILIHRSHTGLNWGSEDSIWFKGREKVVREGLVSIYRDRRNFAGSLIREYRAGGMPDVAPEGFVVEAGKHRRLGYGDVNDWKGRSLVLAVPVDERLNPSGTEFTVGTVARVVEGNRASAFPDFAFLGREKDGTVVLTTGGSGLQNGYVPMGQKPIGKPAVVRVRDGRVLTHWTLPDGWQVVGMSPRGWILVRPNAPDSQASTPPVRPGMTMEETTRAMEKWQSEAGEAMSNREKNWNAGILAKGVITPIRFPRPKGTDNLLWRDGEEVFGPDAFRFSAFYGDVDRTFRVAAPRGSAVK